MPTDIERWDPMQEMMTLRTRIDHLFETMFARPRSEWLAGKLGEPVMNMYEADGKIKLDLLLPGVKPEELELTLSGNTLTIKGERKAKREVKDEHYYRQEAQYGAFSRSVTLPETADVSQPEASFENGIVTVSFPKLKTVEPRRIELKAKELEAQQVG